MNQGGSTGEGQTVEVTWSWAPSSLFPWTEDRLSKSDCAEQTEERSRPAPGGNSASFPGLFSCTSFYITRIILSIQFCIFTLS